jgi:hypothetical protein
MEDRAMAMTLKVECSMCSEAQPLELAIEYKDDLDAKEITKRIQRAGWIVQFNGEMVDTYCTKKCAE